MVRVSMSFGRDTFQPTTGCEMPYIKRQEAWEGFPERKEHGLE